MVGTDPKTGKNIYVRIGRFGPIAQLGESETTTGEKPQFASLQKGQLIESLTLDEALKLFVLPRKLGKYEDEEITVAIGKFGPYIKHKSKFFSIKAAEHDPYSITLEEAIILIKEKLIEEQNKIIKEFSEKAGLRVLNGRFGPYITFEKNNYKIPKGTDPSSLTLDDCLKIMSEIPASGPSKNGKTSRFGKSTKPAATTTTKTVKAKKTTKTAKASKPKTKK